MISLEQILTPRLFDVLDRNGISTARQILILSVWDIKKITNLSIEDILLIKNIVSQDMTPDWIPCDQIFIINNNSKVSTGCYSIDSILKGGYSRGQITEIYGESGSGKTQLGIQAAACNWAGGCVYICTEDLFPVKRYEQVITNLPNYCADVDYGKNIFIEHITEPQDLLSCIRVRLPKLLEDKKVALIIIDSIAAPFRVDSLNYRQRAEDLRELAINLIDTAQSHNIAVICINQVMAAFDESLEDVIPSLGLAWSNMINVRLFLKKTKAFYVSKGEKSNIRELSTEFAPDLPYSNAKFAITASGIKDV